VRKFTLIASSVAVGVVVVGAYIGNASRTEHASDSDAMAQSLGERPASQPLTTKQIFPEPNVSYTVTRAFTGGLLGVAEADGVERRVTLFGIRSPKLDENLGVESRDFLSKLLAGKAVILKRRAGTKEAETIAEVLADGINVGLEQIRRGMAVLDFQQITSLPEIEQSSYLEAASIAKNSRNGIWSVATGESSTADTLPIEPSETEQARPVRNDSAPLKRREEPNPATQLVDHTSVPELEAAISKENNPTILPSESPSGQNETASPQPDKLPATAARKYVRGPRGGCYYITSSGTKAYVDRSACD